MFDAISRRTFPRVKERFMGPKEAKGAEPAAHAGLRGGLERDLERLQGLLDAAVEQLRHSLTSMNDAMNADPAGEQLREGVRADVDRVVTSLQFHDLASQMISNMRGRAQLLETAALTAAPGEARSRLLAEALQLSKRSPDAVCDRRGDVDLF